MKRIDAQFIRMYTALEVISTVRIALRAVHVPVIRQMQLMAAVERLERACTLFAEGDACEDFEDCYLPIFDGLNVLKDALRKPAEAEVFMRLAADILTGEDKQFCNP